jgi:hypothetical protein
MPHLLTTFDHHDENLARCVLSTAVLLLFGDRPDDAIFSCRCRFIAELQRDGVLRLVAAIHCRVVKISIDTMLTRSLAGETPALPAGVMVQCCCDQPVTQDLAPPVLPHLNLLPDASETMLPGPPALVTFAALIEIAAQATAR